MQQKRERDRYGPLQLHLRIHLVYEAVDIVGMSRERERERKREGWRERERGEGWRERERE